MAEHTPNFVVTSLTDYINNNKDLILASFGLVGNGTRERVTTLTGVKYKERLNYLEIEPELQDGESCGFTPQSGGLTLTEKDIVVVPLKVDLDICPRTLRKKFANYLIRMNAVAEADRIPFEAEVSNGLVEQINKQMEILCWQGNTSLTTDKVKKWYNGWATMALADSDTIKVSSMPTGAYEGILAVYMAMPAEVLKRGGEIFVAPEIYRVFLQDMVVKNYYHYAGPQNAAPTEFILPGTNVKVVETEGLAGSLSIFGTWSKNLVYATDMENDEEEFDIWYSQDDRIFKMEALWVAGVNYYFSDMIVCGTFSAAPVIGKGVIGNLEQIAANTTPAESAGD